MGGRDTSGKESRAKVWLGKPRRSGHRGPEWPASLRGHYERTLALICSVLLLQGLQGIQGPKVSSGAWVETPLLTADSLNSSRKPC